MKHLGDITKIDGYSVPIVDCIIGGSPCQDLSIAGKRAGLDGERSGLYMEQIRLVKEMRLKDEHNGRTGVDVRPRYMVWENVPGAFSSNKGEDFRIVLEELAKIKDKYATIPMPDKGKWTTAGCIMGDGWSIAWRVLDAQFWGVPQRRRRIALVADFGGQSAPEILFVRKSVSGHSDESEPKRKETPSDASRGIGADDRDAEKVAIGVDCYNQVLTGDKSKTLTNVASDTDHIPVVVTPYILKIRSGCEGGGKGALVQTDKSATLSTLQDQILFQPIYSVENHPNDSRVGINEDGIVQTLSSRMGTGGGNVPSEDFETWKESDTANTLNSFDIGDVRTTEAVVYAIDQGGGKSSANVSDGTAPTLTCTHGGEPAVAYSFDPGASRDVGTLFIEEVSKTITNGTCPGHHDGVCIKNGTRYIVRRLTPLECERLQGYPSELKLDISKMTKDEYIAYNILEGNIIVDAEAGKVYRTRGSGGATLDKPQEMKGSDCNGYLVVKISNGTTKMSCRVHRIIWISQHGVIPDGYCIDHINSNKKDNRISNLQLLTPQENSTKAAKEGLYATGEDNGATKISPDLWDEIAYLHHCESKTMRQLAEIYGISKSRVQQIVKEVGWTDIGDWTDSKGKVHKTSDASRYKALGNSIALPPWKWVLKRICACYERDATMASLFDGIGGFPYLWEQLNGKGTCLWASEIEEFPMAVTKVRIG